MDLKWKLLLVQCILLPVVRAENISIEDYFRVECGAHQINPFEAFCHNGVEVKCDKSHCQERLVENSRKGCALFCEQVLQKLEQLPKEIAARVKMQDEAALNQQRIRQQYVNMTTLLDQIKIQKLTIADNMKTITAEQERNTDLQLQKRAFIISLIVIIVLLLVLLVVCIVRNKPSCVRRNRRRSSAGADEGLLSKDDMSPDSAVGSDVSRTSVTTESGFQSRSGFSPQNNHVDPHTQRESRTKLALTGRNMEVMMKKPDGDDTTITKECCN